MPFQIRPDGKAYCLACQEPVENRGAVKSAHQVKCERERRKR